MAATPSQDERPPSLVGRGRPAPPNRAPVDPGLGFVPPDRKALPSLSADESSVLRALSEVRHLSFGVLRSRTGASTEELRSTLERLRAKGLVTRLNTVVESYSSRFPGLRVDD